MLVAAGCGGSSAKPEAATVLVRGPGFVVRAPADRTVDRTGRSVTVQPPGGNGVELESVSRFPLVKRFRPSLWPGVVAELDGVADKLASRLGGSIETSEDVRLGGLRGRRYEIAYERNGEQLRQRITFVFRPRQEYQLLCRYVDGPPPEACLLLETSFRVV